MISFEKTHRVLFQTEPSCSTWHKDTAEREVKQPFGETLGWNEQHYLMEFIAAHRWDEILADSRRCSEEKRADR